MGNCISTNSEKANTNASKSSSKSKGRILGDTSTTHGSDTSALSESQRATKLPFNIRDSKNRGQGRVLGGRQSNTNDLKSSVKNAMEQRWINEQNKKAIKSAKLKTSANCDIRKIPDDNLEWRRD
ncbi:hypothetical protein GGI26_001000 [Coemansia sp. RSA 1358]|nr:hypothetical protein GGI26_001000 [Coemansia sp. RSA 1358]